MDISIDEDSALKSQELSINPQLKRTFRVNNRNYEYNGPANMYVEELFTILQQPDISDREHIKKIEGFLKKELRSVSIEILLTLIIYCGLYFASVGQIVAVTTSNSDLKTIADNIPWQALIFVVITLTLKMYNNSQAILGILQLVPLFVGLYYVNAFHTYSGDYNYTAIITCFAINASYLNGIFLKALKSYIQQELGQLMSFITHISWCVLMIYCIIFQLLTYLVVINNYTTKTFVNIITQQLAGPVFVFLLIINIVIIRQVFKLSKETIKDILLEHKLKINEVDLSYIPQRQSWISILIFSLVYFFIEIFSFIALVSELYNSRRTQYIVTFAILLIGTPVYTLIGVITQRHYQLKNSLLYVAFVLGMIQIGSVKLGTYLDKSFSPISFIIKISPLLVFLIWITQRYFLTNLQTLRIMMTSWSCLFFAFPLGFLLPIAYQYSSTVLFAISIIFLVIGIIPLIMLIVNQSIKILSLLRKLPEQSQRLDFKEYTRYNLTKYAMWINAVLFSISYNFILYYVWNIPSTASDTQRGAIVAIAFLLQILFILINVALRCPSTYSEDMDSDNEMKENLYLRQKQVIVLGIVVPFVIFLSIGLSGLSVAYKIFFVSLAVGIPVEFFIFRMLANIKNSSEKFQDFLQPIVIVIGWVFVIIPFGVVMPILAINYEASSYAFGVYAQLSVAYGLLVGIIGVTGTSLFFSILLNQEELEQKKRKILRYVMQIYADNSVFPEYRIVSLLFMKYLLTGRKVLHLENLLQKGDPINRIDYKGSELYNKQLISRKEFESLKQKTKPVKQQDNDKSCFVQLLDCVYCRIGVDELQEMEEAKFMKQTSIEKQQLLGDGSHLNMYFLQPSGDELKKIMKSDYYCALKVKPERVPQFWECIFSRYQSNMPILFQQLNLPFTENNLSKSMFLRLLLSKIHQPNQTQFKSLWEFTILKYPLFVHNITDLRTSLRVPISEDSPFSQNQMAKLEDGETIISQREGSINIEEYTKISKTRLKVYQACKCMRYYAYERPIEIVQMLYERIRKAKEITVQQKVVVKEMPPWEDLSKMVVNELHLRYEEYEIEEQNRNFKFNINFTNCFALINRIYDIYGICSLAFDPQAGWFGTQSFTPFDVVDGTAIYNSYDFFFFISFSMCIVYYIFGNEAQIQVAQGTYGLDKTGQIAGISTWNFWLTKVVVLLNGQFILVMKTFIDAFVCNYDSYPYKLTRQPTLTCMSSSHFAYVALALFGAAIYYPLCTFMQPSLQYMDNTLDLKYKCSYIVIYVQAKLLVLGVNTIFDNLKSNAFLYQMLFGAIVMAIIVIIHYKMKPCYVRWFNRIELLLFVFTFECFFGAFLIAVSGTNVAGLVWLGVTGIPTLLYLVYDGVRKYFTPSAVKIANVHPAASE